MKKFIALLLCAVMALTAVSAFADSRTVSPSKTIKDLYTIEMHTENFDDKSTASVVSLYHDDEASAEFVSAMNAEAEAYKEAGAAESYFTESEFRKLNELLPDKLTLDDIIAVFIDEYEEEMGKAEFTIAVPKLYEKDEKVILAVKCIGEDACEWVFIEGLGLEDGSVLFTVDDADFMIKCASSYMMLEMFSIEK